MNPARWSAILPGLLLLLLILATPVAARQAEPRLACDFEVEQVSVGDEIVMTLYAWDVRGLFAYQFDLSYDPERVAVVDADPQRAGTNAVLRDFLRPDLVIYNEDDPRAGVLLLGASAAYPSEPVSGSGPLAQVRFRAESPGETTFAFANVTLADDQAQVFTAGLENCTLTVLPAGEPTATRAPREAGPTGSTDVPDSVATAVAGVVGSQEVDETAGAGTPEAETPPPAGTPAGSEAGPQGNFWLSALIGFAAVAGLAGLVVVVLWWRWRTGSR